MRIPVEYHKVTGRVRHDWTVPMINPADRAALSAVLKAKEHLPGCSVTVIHLGPESGETLIRECLALGCDSGVRVWDDEFEGLQPFTKALIFSRVAQILRFDLICTGARSQDTGNGQLGILIASRLGIPCVTSVVDFEISSGERVAKLKKMLARGYHAFIESPLPLVIGMESSRVSDLAPSLAHALAASEGKIPCWNLADLGISRQHIVKTEGSLSLGALRFPRSKLRFIPAPESTLPAFLRIKKLVEGTVSTREGRIVGGLEDQVVEELFNTLLREGWLDHIRKIT